MAEKYEIDGVSDKQSTIVNKLDIIITRLSPYNVSLKECIKIDTNGNIVCLKLSNSNLSKIPEVIKKLDTIEELYLNNNFIHEIPSFILQLENLKKLDISNNNINLDSFFKLTPDYVEKAIQVASIAFQDDPFTIFVYPDERERRQKLQYGFKMLYEYGIRNGVTYATSNNLEGIVIWLPPNKIYPSTWTMMRHGGFYTIRKVGLKMKAMKRTMAIFKYEESAHKDLVPFDHWYLQNIAVKPEEQRKGYGGLLVGAMLSAT